MSKRYYQGKTDLKEYKNRVKPTKQELKDFLPTTALAILSLFIGGGISSGEKVIADTVLSNDVHVIEKQYFPPFYSSAIQIFEIYPDKSRLEFLAKPDSQVPFKVIEKDSQNKIVERTTELEVTLGDIAEYQRLLGIVDEYSSQ